MLSHAIKKMVEANGVTEVTVEIWKRLLVKQMSIKTLPVDSKSGQVDEL